MSYNARRNQLTGLLVMQASSGSCTRPVINEDQLQDHACAIFEKVCVDQVTTEKGVSLPAFVNINCLLPF